MAMARGMVAELAKLLATVSAPIYLLDERRKLVYCNAACSDWLETPAEELLGKACVYASSDEAIADPIATRVAGLCPPPEVFAGSRAVAFICSSRSDGRLLRRRVEFIPFADETEGAACILAIAEPTDLSGDGAGSLSTSDAAESAGDGTPPDESQLLHQQLQQAHHELRRLRQMDRLLGNSPAMVRVRAQVQLASAGMAAVLVVGPPGSGRHHVARAVHYSRHEGEAGSFVPLSCALLGSDLLRSTLSALLVRDAADRRSAGTLLLGDVHELPLEVQSELVGNLKNASALRIVSTSIAPLDELAAAGRFRADLACALSTVVIHLPPLAERREDVPILSQALLEEFNARGEKQLRGFSPEALDLLAAYPWPGNIDELAAIVRSSHANAEGPQVSSADLPQVVHLAAAAGRISRRKPQPIDLEKFLGEIERELIARAMRLAKGNKTKAARLLNLTRPRLYRRMVQLGLEAGAPLSPPEPSPPESSQPEPSLPEADNKFGE